MRLLRTKIVDGELQLVSFDNPKDTLKYAILSHTWVNGQEVLFHHITSKDPSVRALSGYQKVIGCCQQALKDGYKYVWIDTCCIDKTSSAELSEAINSMFLWYQQAAVCYAFLSDLPSWATPRSQNQSKFRRAKWFTRGWTLQELIAPSLVSFYAADWTLIGDKKDLADTIMGITGIDRAVLHGAPFSNLSIATRMSWASDRKTTRVEDRAYSLMGLFGVNMPTIYGEGNQAFIRLQHEIMALSAAHSLLAWNAYYNRNMLDEAKNLLASSPDVFKHRSAAADNNHVIDIPHRDFARIWNIHDAATGLHKELNGMRAVLPVFEVPETQSAFHDSRIDAIAVLACKITDRQTEQFPYALALRRSGPPMSNHYVKAYPVELMDVDTLVKLGIPWTVKSLFLVTDSMPDPDDLSSAMAKSTPEKFEFKVSRENMEKLNEIDDLVFLPHSAGIGHVEIDQAFEVPPTEYQEAENGDFVFDVLNDLNGKSQSNSITFSYSPLPGDTKRSHPVSLAIFAVSNIVGLGLLCWHSAVPSTDIGFKRGTPHWLMTDDTVVCHVLRCKCGLAMEVDCVQIDPPKPRICGFMLDIKVLSHAVAPEVVLEDHSVKQVVVPHQMSHSAYRLRRSPQWVKGTAGFAPPDAIPFTGLDIGRFAYIVRLSQRVDSTENSESHLGRTIQTLSAPAVFRKSGTRVTRMTYEDFGQDSQASIMYDVLAGPINSVRWVQCKGTFNLAALGGASPVLAGNDFDDTALYFARGQWSDDDVHLGIVKEGFQAHFNARNVGNWGIESWSFKELAAYDVLAYA